MNREAFGQTLNLTQHVIAAARPNRPGTPNAMRSITIHNTDNADKGADAARHSKFVRETGYYENARGKKSWVSWHYTVDDEQVIQQLPLEEEAYHAGGAANADSIAIEICMHKGIDQAAANDRAARLVAALFYDLKSLNRDLTRLVTHRSWTGKNCPRLLLNGGQEGAKWQAFQTAVQHHLGTIKP